MTKEELIGLGKQKVRNTPSLLRSYVQLFKSEFGYEPNCAGCSFEKDWRRLTGSVEPQKKNNIMTNTNRTYQLKEKSQKVLRFVMNGKNHYAYSNNTNDEYMTAYLTNGTPEQLAERAKMFKVLPEALRQTVVVEEKPKRKPRKPKK